MVESWQQPAMYTAACLPLYLLLHFSDCLVMWCQASFSRLEKHRLKEKPNKSYWTNVLWNPFKSKGVFQKSAYWPKCYSNLKPDTSLHAIKDRTPEKCVHSLPQMFRDSRSFISCIYSQSNTVYLPLEAVKRKNKFFSPLFMLLLFNRES